MRLFVFAYSAENAQKNAGLVACFDGGPHSPALNLSVVAGPARKPPPKRFQLGSLVTSDRGATQGLDAGLRAPGG